jgi:RNA polymerase sigma-70 factor (ECF subfamily)
MSIVAMRRAMGRRLKPEIDQLFREHSQMLYRTAHSMLGNSADAEDVLQDVFLRLLRGEPAPTTNVRGYLYRAAINSSLNVIRSRKRLEFTDNAERFEGPTDSQSSDVAEELHARLSVALAALKPDDAQVLVLRYLHDRSNAEIAGLLGVSRGTVAIRLFRSRRRLRTLMGAGE